MRTRRFFFIFLLPIVSFGKSQLPAFTFTLREAVACYQEISSCDSETFRTTPPNVGATENRNMLYSSFNIEFANAFVLNLYDEDKWFIVTDESIYQLPQANFADFIEDAPGVSQFSLYLTLPNVRIGGKSQPMFFIVTVPNSALSWTALRNPKKKYKNWSSKSQEMLTFETRKLVEAELKNGVQKVNPTCGSARYIFKCKNFGATAKGKDIFLPYETSPKGTR